LKRSELNKTRLGGGFWGAIFDRVRNQMLPYQWKVLNDEVEGTHSHSVANFKIAAGMMEGRFEGAPFQDTDTAKWIEAVGYQLAVEPDPGLERLADGVIEIIAAAQQPDGYLDTFYIINGLDKRWTNLRDMHELYCAGHMLEAAIAYYEATGKRKLLDVMIRFVDHIASVLGREDGKKRGYPGHEEIELALCKLYDITGEKKYIDLASYFIDERGTEPNYFIEEHKSEKPSQFHNTVGLKYYQAHKPVREQYTIEGHAVRALYLAAGMADVAVRTNDEKLWKACLALYENVTGKRMYVTGGVGSTSIGEAFTFDYDLPNDTVYAETCASIALIFFCQRLLLADPDARYADTIERALYNVCLGSMSLDQTKYFYVNPLSVYPEASRGDPAKRHALPVRPDWHRCACCPPNLARLISSLGRYAYAVDGRRVYVNQYFGGQTELDTEGGPVGITMETDYPVSGHIKIKAGKGDYDLMLRKPYWCSEWSVTGNGERIDAALEKGYLCVKGPFNDDELSLELKMEPRRVYSNPLVRENIGKVCVMRGPVVYCLESTDNGENLHLVSLPADSRFRVEYSPMLEGTVVIRATGRRAIPAGDDLYPETPGCSTEETELTFIPYYKWANRGENEMEVWIREC